MQVRVYRCRHCGNIAIKLVDSGVPMTCCGEAMEELSPASVEASVEKHVPVVTRDGDKVTVDVGSVAHPMTAEHYIQFVALETASGIQVKYLNPGEAPKAEFAVLPGAEVKKAYAYCNLHGLWADA